MISLLTCFLFCFQMQKYDFYFILANKMTEKMPENYRLGEFSCIQVPFPSSGACWPAVFPSVSGESSITCFLSASACSLSPLAR